jgi:hypothetical protein
MPIRRFTVEARNEIWASVAHLRELLEHTVDGDVVAEQATHDVDLLEYSVDEFGAVAGSDEQSFDPWPDESAFELEVRTALVDAGGSHGLVVDVCPASGDPPVMQRSECLGGELVEPAAEPLLAKRSDVPGLGGLLLFGDREDEAAEFRVLGADALFALSLAAPELSTR